MITETSYLIDFLEKYKILRITNNTFRKREICNKFLSFNEIFLQQNYLYSVNISYRLLKSLLKSSATWLRMIITKCMAIGFVNNGNASTNHIVKINLNVCTRTNATTGNFNTLENRSKGIQKLQKSCAICSRNSAQNVIKRI